MTLQTWWGRMRGCKTSWCANNVIAFPTSNIHAGTGYGGRWCYLKLPNPASFRARRYIAARFSRDICSPWKNSVTLSQFATLYTTNVSIETKVKTAYDTITWTPHNLSQLEAWAETQVSTRSLDSQHYRLRLWGIIKCWSSSSSTYEKLSSADHQDSTCVAFLDILWAWWLTGTLSLYIHSPARGTRIIFMYLSTITSVSKNGMIRLRLQLR